MKERDEHAYLTLFMNEVANIGKAAQLRQETGWSAAADGLENRVIARTDKALDLTQHFADALKAEPQQRGQHLIHHTEALDILEELAIDLTMAAVRTDNKLDRMHRQVLTNAAEGLTNLCLVHRAYIESELETADTVFVKTGNHKEIVPFQ